MVDFHSDKKGSVLERIHSTASHLRLDRLAAKTASATAEVEELPASAFADPVNRHYPMNSKEATVLSYAYALDGGADEPTMSQLKKAGDLWGVQLEFEELEQHVKQASEPTESVKFACDAEIDGEQVQLFPWHDQETLKAASNRFMAHRSRFPLKVRRQVAAHVVKHALDLDPMVADYAEKVCGGSTLCPTKLASAIMTRRSYLGREKTKLAAEGVFDQLSEAVDLVLTRPAEEQLKLACEVLEAFDNDTGLARRYGKSLTLPEEAIYGESMSKTASEEDGQVKLMNGRTINASDVDWLKVAEYDSDLAEMAAEDGYEETLAALPRPDADLLMDVCGL